MSSSSGEVHIVALLYPKEDKVSQFEELLLAQCKDVHTNEPDCHRYLMTKRVLGDEPTYIMIETYKDKQTAEEHGQTQYYKDFVEKLTKEEFMAKPPTLLFSVTAGGFDLNRNFIG